MTTKHDENDKILAVLYSVIDELNETRLPAEQVVKDPDAPLIGDGGSLDSLGLVNLAVTAEERLAERLGIEAPLTSVIGTAPAESPFRTLRALSAHVAGLAGS